MDEFLIMALKFKLAEMIIGLSIMTVVALIVLIICWNIPKDAWDQIKENKFIWEAHSHPTITNLNPSVHDIDTLKLFTWQEKSCIIDLNNEKIYFSAEVQDWFNAILGVKENVKSRRRLKFGR